jgi:hypothetical protein
MIDWLYKTIQSTKFFVATVVLLAVQSIWLAFTAIYPLPFDEFVHVGSMQLYARQWLPFIAQQPPGTGVLGDVTREPSFLYHYLMSFPYRVVDVFADSQMVLVVSMRLINVVFVVGALVLFRKLLLTWGTTRRITHVALLAFVVTPIVPFLAAHVNYDNLMLLLTPVVLLLATRLLSDNHDLVRRSLLFVLSGLATLLVKQTFLPLLVIVFCYVVFVVWHRNRHQLSAVVVRSWRTTPKNWVLVALCLGLVVLGGLFVERYGGNLLRYQSIRPACDKVQPRELCEDFGPWYRNNVINVQNRPAEPPYGNPVSFSQYWVSRMMRGYYAIFQHTPTRVVWEHEPFGPIEIRPLLPLLINVGCVVLLLGLGALWVQRKQLWSNPYLRFGLTICVFYVATLWLFNYRTYLRLYKAEAIQARYTYPILLILFALMAQSMNRLVPDKKTKVGLLVVVAALYVWGGGIAGWLIRADDAWRWQHPTVQSANHKVQQILRYTVIH